LSELRISDSLSLPIDAPVHRLAFIGTTNSGKSYAASKLAELMWDAGMQFVAVDIMGIWYGLRLDGTGKGIPITIFGGAHGDIATSEYDGALVADIIHETGISAIIDISEFEGDAAKVRFATRFAERLYLLRKQKPGAIHLFLEEAHEYLPQTGEGGDAHMIHVWNRLWKQGGNFGIGGSLITQRPQDVNTKARDLSSCVFAFNTTGTNAVKAMRAWMGKEEADGILKLQQGECFIWSPAWLQHHGLHRILPKKTQHVRFDPFASVAEPAPQTLAAVGISAIRDRFDAEAAKRETEARTRKPIKTGDDEYDPTEDLRSENMRLMAANDQLAAELATWKRFGSDVVSHINSLGKLAANLGHETGILDSNGKPYEQYVVESPRTVDTRFGPMPMVDAPVAKTRNSKVQALNTADGTKLGTSRAKILDAILAFERVGIAAPGRAHVGVFAGYSPNGGTFKTYMSGLKTAGYINYPGDGLIELTTSGRALAKDPGEPPTLHDLHERWCSMLNGPRASMLRQLIKRYPKPMTREELGEATGYSPDGGTYKTYVSGLSSLGLILYPSRGLIAAAPILFPQGLK
jgi:uncharacterized protein